MERFILISSQYNDDNDQIILDTHILSLETCWDEIFLYWKQRIPEPLRMEIHRLGPDDSKTEIIVGFFRKMNSYQDFEDEIYGSEKETLERYNLIMDEDEIDEEEED